jgi:hypothetical protein
VSKTWGSSVIFLLEKILLDVVLGMLLHGNEDFILRFFMKYYLKHKQHRNIQASIAEKRER